MASIHASEPYSARHRELYDSSKDPANDFTNFARGAAYDQAALRKSAGLETGGKHRKPNETLARVKKSASATLRAALGRNVRPT
ncbi:TPA: hypothetical protein DIV49_02480 [Candidatus Saccharibacteria bacterium]|nr:hypothetical protein [Candidatus Saccharibacteria bacterium]HRJ91367.1 hypothetical protein [Candidatus Saccharibacteria bacterium]